VTVTTLPVAAPLPMTNAAALLQVEPAPAIRTD